mgnify:FL=1
MIIHKDLSHQRDEKTVLRNPHKGWYWHYYDNGMRRVWYRDRLKGDETYHDFPGLNHLYFRIDWYDVQPAPNVFDWSEIDKVMEKWGKLGYTFSFRVCCSETNEAQCFAVPKWLYDMGCKGVFIPPTRDENPQWWETKFGDDSIEVFNRIVGNTYHRYWEPDYSDPLFLKYLDKFMQGFAEKYDNDPRIEYIDLGSYGNWGEGHVCFGSRKSAPIEVLKEHAYIHKKHFKNKFVLMNDDFITHLYDCTEDQKQELLDWCISLGMGIRDDSIIAGAYEKRAYHTIEAPYMFDEMYKYAPVDLELGHYWSYNRDNAKDGLVIVEAARRGHATYAGFHTYPEDWLKDNYFVTEYLANRLGYWYAVNSVTHHSIAYRGTKTLFSIEIENMGFAPCYYKYTLELKLSNERNSYIYHFSDFDNRMIFENEKKTAKILANIASDTEPGIYSVSIRMRENQRVIWLALRRDICDDSGFYHISEIEIK